MGHTVTPDGDIHNGNRKPREIEFVNHSHPDKKTKRFLIRDKNLGHTLGTIKWHVKYWCHVFTPAMYTSLTAEEMEVITAKLKEL